MAWKKVIAVVMVILLIAFVGGCGLSGGEKKLNGEEQTNPSQEQPKVGQEAPQQNETNTPPVNPQPTQEQVELTLYFSDNQAMYFEPEKRTVAKEGKPLANLLIEELIKGPQKEGLKRTIPEGTTLLSLDIAEGVAFVNFSKEMKTKHWGGTTGETMTCQSVVLTLTQLPEIAKVQFLIEGKKEEFIWGHGYTGEPITPQKNLIAK